MKYQTIIEAPAGTDMDVLSSVAPVFKGLSELLDLSPAISHRRMPGTRDFNGRMLIHMEIKNITAVAQVMAFLAVGSLEEKVNC